METFLKRSCKLMFKFDVIFEILKLSITVDYKTSINCVAVYGIIHTAI